jgi:hypothetical protein
VTYRQMDARLQNDYTLSPELAANWNAYMAAGDFAGTYESQVREHMRMYYRFRYRWLGRMAQLPACQRATPQEQQDMVSYDDLFKGDMELLRERAKGGHPRKYRDNGDEIKFFAPSHSHMANREQLLRADMRQAPDDREALALQVFEEQRGQPKDEGIALLEEQVHDSLAGFYLGGYISAEEKAEKLRTWQTKPPSREDSYNYQAWQNFEKAKANNRELQKILDDKAALAKQAETARFNGRTGEMESLQRRVAFTDEESSLLTQDAHGQPIFPVQKDSDANALCSILVATQTETLREGGGYLSSRFVFLP